MELIDGMPIDGMHKEDASTEGVKRHYALLDLLLISFWFLLTGIFFSIFTASPISYYSLYSGLLIASIVTLTAHKFVIRGVEREKTSIWEYLDSMKNVFKLMGDVFLRLIVANAVLIYQSISLDVEPRIVRVKVDLDSESEITLISLLITLVPGTLVLDVEEEEDEYFLYVHYSYLKSENLAGNMESTIKRWDQQIRGIFR